MSQPVSCHSQPSANANCYRLPAVVRLLAAMCAQVRIVRIFNTYGPRMALDDGRVVSNFVSQALTNKPITVYGDGQQTRSFQYVSDLVKGLVTVMDGPEIGPFNIGNPVRRRLVGQTSYRGRSRARPGSGKCKALSCADVRRRETPVVCQSYTTTCAIARK